MTEKSFGLTIGKKILLGFSILIFIFMGMALHTYDRMTEMSVLAEKAIPLSYQLSSLQEFAISLETLEKDIDKNFTVNYKENQEKVEKDFDEMKSVLKSLEINADNNSIVRLQEMEKIRTQIRTNFDYLVNIEPNSAKSMEINEKRYLIYELINNERQNHRELLLETTNKIQVNVNDQKALISGLIRELLMLGTFILVIGGFLSFITSRSISGPIKKLRAATTEIGKGQFNAIIPIHSNDEVGQLASAFNKMTQELQKTTVSKDFVENIFQSMFDMLVVTNPDGTIQTVNKAICDLLGYRSEELTGQSIDKLIYGDITHSESSWFNEIIKNAPLINIEKNYIAKDGRKIPVLLSMSSLCDHKGNIIGSVCVARDITERKKAELEYKTILKTAMDGFYIVDSQGHILDANDSYCTLIGYTHDELLNLTLKDIDVIDSEEVIAKRIEQISKNGWARFETSHKCKDGRIVRIEASVNYMRTEGGRFYVFMRDITERMKFDNILKENEERFRSVAQSANDAIITVDVKGDIIFWNNSAHKIFGYNNEEVIGNPLTFLMPEIYRDGHTNGLKRFVATGESHFIGKTVELSGIRKNGNTFPLELSLSTWNVGGAIFFTGILKDITERKRSEEALTSSLSLLNATLESTADGILVVDQNGRITRWNQKFADMWQIPREVLSSHSDEQVLNYAIKQLVHPETLIAKIKELDGQSDATSIDQLDLTSGRFFEQYSQPQKIGDDIVGRVWSFRDITQRKQSEEKIRKSLEEKEVLLREIHHRVKNNMQIVASLLNLQSQNIEDKKYKNVFIDSQSRIYAMALIHEKLYQSESLAQINLKEYIDGIVSNIFESYGQKSNIKLDINIKNILINIDYAVPCGLIINELLTNSFKYAFPDGRQGIIKISAKSNDNDMIQISISDNGIGIAKDLDIRNTKSLGLKLITSLAESQLHGQIILNRESGTEFIINFKQAK